HPGVDDDAAGWLVRLESETVRCYDRCLRPGGGEILSRSGGKGRVDLDRRDATGAADDLGEDGAIVGGTSPDMDDMVATAQLGLVVHASPKAGLPVVELPLLVDRDQHVVVEWARIGVLRPPILGHRHRAADAPR